MSDSALPALPELPASARVRVRELIKRNGRTLLGLVGAPGAGKSTLAAALLAEFADVAQVWRGKVRDERELELIATDPHSPAQFRADGTTINADAYHDAFHTKPGDKMWKAPDDRLRLW